MPRPACLMLRGRSCALLGSDGLSRPVAKKPAFMLFGSAERLRRRPSDRRVSAMKPLASASAACGISSPSAIAIISLAASVASGPRSAIVPAQAVASARLPPVSTTRSTTPSASASVGEQDLAAERHAPHHLRAEAAHRALRARPARHHADRGLREAELHMRFGDAEIAGRRQFQSAAQRMAGQHGDRRLAQPRQPVEDAMAIAHPFAPGNRRRSSATRPRHRRRRKSPCPRRAAARRARHRQPRPRRAPLPAHRSIGMSSALNFSGRRSVIVPIAPSCSKVTSCSASTASARRRPFSVQADRRFADRGVRHHLQIVGDAEREFRLRQHVALQGRCPARSR